MSFSGSYRSQDVTFLLKPLPQQVFVDVADKERLIQSGARHYSEMLSLETLPSARYQALFRDACNANNLRMARDCLRLATLIAERRSGPVTVVSLARAGTPVGVVVGRLLHTLFGRRTRHYSVSIIRDRGIDEVALRHILGFGHAPESLVFVDGWTGKGVIGRELAQAVEEFNRAHGVAIDGGLYVLSDLAGEAACAASCDDYLIPSSILQSTVSGLVSRSVLNGMTGPHDFHGCVYYGEFMRHDVSQSFADELVQLATALGRARVPVGAARPEQERARAQATARAFAASAMREHGIADINMLKPGIGEATRVLLRRVPHLVVLRDAASPEVAHLRALAQEKGVEVRTDPALPYHAVSLIRSTADA